MDIVEAVTFVVTIGNFVLLVAILLGLRFGLPQLMSSIGAKMRAELFATLVVSEEVDGPNGTKVVRHKPSPMVAAMLAQIAPVIVSSMIKWASENLVKKDASGAPALGPGGQIQLDPTEIAKHVPKQFKGLVPIFLPMVQGWLSRNIGTQGAATSTAENPFLKSGG